MRKRFEGVTKIEDHELFELMSSYCDALIDEATSNGSLDDLYASNEYTREIGRVGCLCADYESDYMTFKHIRPLRAASCFACAVVCHSSMNASLIIQ
jgi:hypothetical protein